MIKLIVTSVCGLLAVAVGAAPPVSAPEVGMQSPQVFRKQVTREVVYNYLLYLPDGYGQEPERDQKWPLVVFLHGIGERGTDVNRVKSHGPPKLVAEGKHFPFILVSPQCPPDSFWRVDDLDALLDEIVAQHAVDRDRVYVTGLSMGGAGTWEWITRRPDRFAAAVPICGFGNHLFLRRTKPTPLWAFHGEKDEAVPVEQSQKLVDAVRAAGGNPKLTIYPGVGHDSWTRTYENPEVWEWLLSHERKQD